MKLVLATNNEGKVREFARILEPLGIEVMTQNRREFMFLQKKMEPPLQKMPASKQWQSMRRPDFQP